MLGSFRALVTTTRSVRQKLSQRDPVRAALFPLHGRAGDLGHGHLRQGERAGNSGVHQMTAVIEVAVERGNAGQAVAGYMPCGVRRTRAQEHFLPGAPVP